MSENFTEINDFILDQIYGYQDANEVKNNTLRLRDALSLEHTWSPIDDTDLGTHKDIPFSGLKSSTVAISHTLAYSTTEILDYTDTEDLLVAQTGRCFAPYGTTFRITRTNGGTRSMTGHGTLELLHYSDEITATDGTAPDVSDDIDTYVRSTMFYTPDTGAEVTGNMYITGEVTFLTASPPHKFFEIEDYGYFCFAIRDRSSGKIRTCIISQDPHWFNVRKTKDDPELIKNKPHPFKNYAPYTDVKPEDDNKEIVMFDMQANPLKITEKNIRSIVEDVIDGKYLELSKSQLEPEYVKDIPREFTDFVRIIKIDESLKEEEKREN